MRVYKLLIAITILLLLIGCTQEDDSAIASNPIHPAIQAVLSSKKTTFYSDAQLSDIADFIGPIDQLFPQYPPTHIRPVRIRQSINDLDDALDGFSVFYLGEAKALELMIYPQGTKDFKIMHNMIESKKVFNALTIGQTLSDVQSLDPDGSYTTLYMERVDIPECSMHYTRDGFIICITYDDNNVITGIYITKMSFTAGDGLREP